MEINLKPAVFSAVLLLMFVVAPAHAVSVNIAAIVGEEVITTTDLAERRALVMATAGIPETVENQQKITPRVMQSLIDETLQMQEAKRQSISVTDEELAQAIEGMATRGTKQSENLRSFVKKQGLSERSLNNQVRAQLAWKKLVQRKLRRNVNVSQEEVLRAQQSAAASPGEEELRIALIELTFSGATLDASTKKLAEDITLQLKTGTDIATVAARYIKQREVNYKPALWVAEQSLPLPLQQTLHSMKPGEVTPPLPGGKSVQLIQLLDRKTAPKLYDSTEYAIKQMSIAVPAKRDKTSLTKLRQVATYLRAHPGNCTEEKIPAVDLPTEVKFVRTQLSALNPEQRSVVTHLEIGQVSDPLMSPEALRLVMLCEKIEPSTGALPDAELIRQQLFADKLELEAQKHMRNLRRDAYIDMKAAQ